MARHRSVNTRKQTIKRDITTVTREELELAVKTDTFTKLARRLGVGYDPIRKLVREQHKDLYDLFVWNGFNKNKTSGVAMDKRAYGNYKKPEDYPEAELRAVCMELSYNYASRKLNVTRDRLEIYLKNQYPELHAQVVINGLNMRKINRRGKSNV